MAMFLSRLKQILNLGTKSITANGTYTASSDGYDGYSEVTVNVPTPTSITPSNSNPARMTANTPVNPTANGYAISAYYAITPVSTPESVETGDIVKFSGDGYIVDSNPTTISITPSNTNPARMTANTPVKPTANGYAIASYDNITPSSIGEFVSSGDIVKFGGNGVILDLPPVDITPSNDTPEPLRVGMSFKVTTNGFAIEGIDDVIYPNYNPKAVSADSIVKIGAYNGYVIDDYDDITPSSTPVSAGYPNVHINGNSAIIVDDITDLTPTSIPENVSAGDNIHFEGSGVIVDSIPTPTSITPSNASPVALSSGVAVEPTRNGYAIAGYDNITPSSTPQAIHWGDMLSMRGNGFVIDNYIPVTPSDSTPPQLSQGYLYEPTGNGYLYATQQGGSTETVLWTNGSPTSQFSAHTITLSDDYTNYDYLEIDFRSSTSNNSIFRAIIPTITIAKSSSLSTFTIGNNDSNGGNNTRARGLYADTKTSLYITGAYPLSGSSAADSYVIPTKIVGISVALPPSVGNVKVGTCSNTSSSTANISVTLGFKPKYLCVTYANSMVLVYDERHSTTKYYRCASTPSFDGQYSLGSTSGNTIQSINDDGFTIRSSSNRTWNYFAIG